MEQVTLRARERTELGSRPSRRLRRQGMVPAVVYGRGLSPIPVTVSARELHAALHTEAGLNAVISLEIEDRGEPILTVARELQRDPVRGDISHLDLITVRLDEPIEAEVGIELLGAPVGVWESGGVLETLEATVLVEALPTAVPSSIEVDVSHMEVGDVLKVADLPELDGVTYLAEPEHPIATVTGGVEEEEEEVPAEEVEAALEVPGEAPEAG